MECDFLCGIVNGQTDRQTDRQKINLDICNRKCKLYCPSGSFDRQVEIPVVIDGTEIL